MKTNTQSTSRRIKNLIFVWFLFNNSIAFAHHTAEHSVVLHTNSTWSECAMVIDPSLTQDEFNIFNKDVAPILASLSPLNSAQTLGKNRFDIAMAYVVVGPIKDYDGSWNNTFSHPNSEHWLVPDDHLLRLPALNASMGVSRDMDVGIMFTMAPGANYGFVGANVKYALIKEQENGVTVSGRLSYVGLINVADMNSNQGSVDLLVSRQYGYFKPYVAVSGLFNRTSETTDKVALQSANAISAVATAGTQFDWKYLTLSAEADFARINTYTLKIGTQF